MQVDDDSDEEDDEQCCGEVEIIFCDVPEEDAKDEEDIERFDDFVDEQFYDGWFFDDHGSWSVGVFEMEGVCFSHSFFYFLNIGECFYFLFIVVGE